MKKQVIIFMAAMVAALALGFSQPVKAQSGYTVYLAIFYNNCNEDCGTWTSSGRWTAVCVADTSRGALYHQLSEAFNLLVTPLAVWLSQSCNCGSNLASALGAAVGTIIGRAMAVVFAVFALFIKAIQAAVAMIASLLGMVRADAVAPSINCTADMWYFCYALAAIAALDGWAGGWITTLTVLLVCILSFYLGVYVIREVRELMQPTGAGE